MSLSHLKFTKPQYARQNSANKQRDLTYHYKAQEACHKQLLAILAGNEYLLKANKDNLERQFKQLRSFGIITNTCTLRRIKQGRYKTISFIVLQYIASYHNITVVELYEIGVKAIKEIGEL